MENLLYKINRWFELNVGWFFINGYKALEYEEYIKNKYFENEDD